MKAFSRMLLRGAPGNPGRMTAWLALILAVVGVSCCTKGFDPTATAGAGAGAASAAATAEPGPELRRLVVNLGVLRPLVYRVDSIGDDGAPRWTGLEYELIRAFARKEGYRLDERPITDVRDKLEGVAAGEVDLAIGAIDITVERARTVRFSRATVVSGKAILVRDADPGASAIRSHWDLAGRRVSTKRATTSVDVLAEIGAEAVTGTTFEDALEILRRGEAAALVFDAPVVWDFANRDEGSWVRVVGEVFNPVGYGVAVDPRKPWLVDELNRFLDEYVGGREYREQFDRFLGAR